MTSNVYRITTGKGNAGVTVEGPDPEVVARVYAKLNPSVIDVDIASEALIRYRLAKAQLAEHDLAQRKAGN